MRALQIAGAMLGVERMHLERRRVHQMARADELVEHLVIAQHVADVLAQKALDALPELLHALHVHLRHPPRAVGRVGRPRLEALDALLRLEIPRDVGHQIPDRRKRAHRLDRDRLATGRADSAASCTSAAGCRSLRPSRIRTCPPCSSSGRRDRSPAGPGSDAPRRAPPCPRTPRSCSPASAPPCASPRQIRNVAVAHVSSPR